MYNLTHAQKRIWYNEKLHDEATMYNLFGTVRIRTDIHYASLMESIHIFIERNDGVRIRIDENNGKPEQYFHPYNRKAIDFFDFSEYEDPYRKFEEWVDEERKKPFTFSNADLFYFAMFKLSSGEGGYIGKFHHIIADGWSLQLVGEQIASVYTSLMNGEPIIRDGNYTYKDYIIQENNYLQSKRFLKNKEFWNRTFATLPNNMESNKNNRLESSRVSFKVDERTSNEIKRFVKSGDMTVNSLFVSALLVYLWFTTGETEQIIGMPVMNRTGKKDKNTFGMFTSTMPFRSEMNDTDQIQHFIQRVHSDLAKCYYHQRYPYDLLVNDLRLSHLGRDSLFNISVNFYNTAFRHLFDSCSYETREVFNGKQPYKLQLVIRDWVDDGYVLDFDYKEEEYDSKTIERAYKHILNIVSYMMKYPQRRVNDIEMLDRDEIDLLTEKFSSDPTYPLSRSVSQLFEEQAELNGDKVACYFENGTMSYKELNEKANRAARLLIKKGVTHDVSVAIIGNHSIKLIVAMLAVLKAGGAYIPIDPHFPANRIQYILEDSRAQLAITNGLAGEAIHFDGEIIDLSDEPTYSEEDGSNVPSISTPESLAYIMYTSGSTGNPKGVMVLQKGLVNYLWWAQKRYLQQDDVFAVYSSISFDLTVTSIFTPLISGGQLKIFNAVDDAEFVLFQIMKDTETTVVKLTPAHLALILESGIRHTNVKKLIVGGEDLKVGLAYQIYKQFDCEITIYNEYGPTETVVGCLIHQYDEHTDTGHSVPIGLPIDNVSIYILNKSLKPVPVGVVGEVYVAGPGVARGYLGKAELTKERFVLNPFAKGERMYKTGDLAMWLESQLVGYVGRADNQVKIRGYRIELGEIEGLLSQYPGISNSVLTVVENRAGTKHLCAYYCSNEEMHRESLNDFLYAHLPAHMIPQFIYRLDAMPLTSNGKIDTKKLPLPDFSGESRAIELPRSEMERVLANVWGEVFGSATIGVHEDYYSLGGDSIKAIQIVSQLNVRGITTNVRDIMRYRTISELSEHVQANGGFTDNRLVEGYVLPTPIMQWYMSKGSRTKPYTQSVLLVLKQPMDVALLERSFEFIIRHHDSFRINKSRNETLYYNNSLVGLPFKLIAFDLSSVNADWHYHKYIQIYEEVKGQVSLDGKFPISAALLDYGRNIKKLLVTAHHLTVDGISWRIIIDDLIHVYKSLLEGKDASLPSKTVSFQKFSQEMMKYSKESNVTKEIGFWNENQRTESSFFNKAKSNASTTHALNFDFIEERFDVETTAKLLTAASSNDQIQPAEILLTALAMGMKEWAGGDEYVYEIETHGRHLENIDVSRTVGWFTAIYPLKIRVATNAIAIVLAEVKERVRGVPNKGLGYGILKHELKLLNESEDRAIRFNYLGQFDFHGPVLEFFDIAEDINGFMDRDGQLSAPIEVNSAIINNALSISLKYSTGMFSKGEIERLLNIYLHHIRSIIQYTNKRLKEYHFTPSDFSSASITKEDIDILFE
ncbi:non-ribosomal peptide synthetase [Paenibacillus macquariensis]|uniref:Non-ribosomal peptide synthase domain TIGR01720/amino acid adenylation domain-containing protein n=1 Tax=Paenibacillus macquariensis TaxID=948756 RepID=A0ABY1K2I6_9BACL|nr:non-ribosomal peptide synthetase [Paenibacillus macquariensis]MEC0090191.1 non-ribosomal peptide synthetase [Paenibacillus macquariensis]OAB39565.1 hypothetical protein PMSM_00060 [Paenibacillus macquariensis subsp. macquariensis]SIR17070.1 non-ribosomal peptide synthase domain TIGR01720/amino acid adenylation domain-containing protein [Paenibacillus macquariensis]